MKKNITFVYFGATFCVLRSHAALQEPKISCQTLCDSRCCSFYWCMCTLLSFVLSDSSHLLPSYFTLSPHSQSNEICCFFVMMAFLKCLCCTNAVLLFRSKTIKNLEEAYWLVFFSSPQTIWFYYTHHTHTGCGTSTAASNPGYIIPCNTKAKRSNVVKHAQYDSILVVTWKTT